MKLIAQIAVCLAIVSLVSTTAEACTCEAPPPPCYEYWRTEAVFVVKVSKVSTNLDNPVDIRVDISVEQNFKGMSFSMAQTANYGHSCAWTFKEGDRFLFYAGLNKANLADFGTNFCTRTRRYDDSSSDLEFLNAVRTGEKKYWVWATVTGGMSGTPIRGVRAEIIGIREKISGLSDENGDIKLSVPNEGTYKVRIFVPKGKSPAGLLRNDQTLQEEQHRIQRGGSQKKRYLDYEVQVKPNRCGWIDLPLANYAWNEDK